MRMAGALVLVGLLGLNADFPRAAQGSNIRFTDVAATVGLDSFLNVAGSKSKDFIVGSTGNGAAFFDYDRDGDLDVLLVNGSTIAMMPKGGHPMVALYRNDGGR